MSLMLASQAVGSAALVQLGNLKGNQYPSATRQFARYQEALENLPPSGGGGCHVALLSVANLGRMAGVEPGRAIEDLAEHIHGTRRVPRSEIIAAVRKAYSAGAFASPPRIHHHINAKRLLHAILERGRGFTLADLWETSEVRVDWPVVQDAIQTLGHLYGLNEKLFIGARHENAADHVQSVRRWIFQFGRGVAVPEHIIPNPLSGEPGATKEGKESCRADSCVAAFRFAVVEFDQMPLDQQIQFWAGVKLPVAALIHSGGKSIHAWVRVDAADTAQWERDIEIVLFDLFRPLGVDGSCRNEARLSRIPGHFRSDKNQWQRILYLAPQGRPVQP
jgi:hypothetical protein